MALLMYMWVNTFMHILWKGYYDLDNTGGGADVGVNVPKWH